MARKSVKNTQFLTDVQVVSTGVEVINYIAKEKLRARQLDNQSAQISHNWVQNILSKSVSPFKRLPGN